jgi:hypothetical protein
MSPTDANALAEKLIRFIETGDVAPGLFAGDVFLDMTMPTWRIQAQGVADVVAVRRDGHPGASRVPRWRCDPMPGGFVVEIEERWDHGGQEMYCRELARADVQDGVIASITIYCTGDWDRARQAEHARDVRLLRP